MWQLIEVGSEPSIQRLFIIHQPLFKAPTTQHFILISSLFSTRLTLKKRKNN
jgi:hypothetical protein